MFLKNKTKDVEYLRNKLTETECKLGKLDFEKAQANVSKKQAEKNILKMAKVFEKQSINIGEMEKLYQSAKIESTLLNDEKMKFEAYKIQEKKDNEMEVSRLDSVIRDLQSKKIPEDVRAIKMAFSRRLNIVPPPAEPSVTNLTDDVKRHLDNEMESILPKKAKVKHDKTRQKPKASDAALDAKKKIMIFRVAFANKIKNGIKNVQKAFTIFNNHR